MKARTELISNYHWMHKLRFVLPAVPKLTKRGQPGADSSLGEDVPGRSTDTGHTDTE